MEPEFMRTPMTAGLPGGMLCSSSSTANFELPFMLSSWGHESAVGHPQVTEDFSEMLMDMMQVDQAGLLKNFPNASLALEQRASMPGLTNYQVPGNCAMNCPAAAISQPLVLMHSSTHGEKNADGHSGHSGSANHSTDTAEDVNGKPGSKADKRAAVQRRYRLKKESTYHELQEQASQQLAALQVLEQQKTILLSKQTTLEKLVHCRDEQLAVLSLVRGMCRDDSSAKSSTCGVQTSTNPSTNTSQCTAKAGLPCSTTQPQQGTAMKKEQPCTGCFGVADCAAPVQPDFDELVRYKQMTVEEVLSWWKQFVTSVSHTLLSQQVGAGVGTSDSGSAGPELRELVSEMGGKMKRIIQLNSSSLYTVMHLNLESGLPAVGSDSHWQGVLQLIKLNPGQKLEMMAMFELYQQLMEKVLHERRMLKSGLSQLTEQAVEHGHVGDACCLSEYMLPSGACVMEEMGFAEQLLLSLHKERSTRCLLTCFLFGRLLTPYQLAQAAVTSYPYFPEPLVLCRTLEAMEQGTKPQTQA